MAEKDKEPEPERELTELEGLALKINEKSDDTLESTRRMREMCAEAKDAGMKTLIALDDQEELIDKFEEAADGINHDMALAEKALKVGSEQSSQQDKCCPVNKLDKRGLQCKKHFISSHTELLYENVNYRIKIKPANILKFS